MKFVRSIVSIGVCVLLFNFYPQDVQADNDRLLMATTTSVDNTGLLEYLVPYFMDATGIELRWIATGSGRAFELGKKGNVDLLFVHAPEFEHQYLKNGFAIKRSEIMFNSFVLLGSDLGYLDIRETDILKALKRIKESGAIFVSRGDDSGTHTCEISLWRSANLDVPENDVWYVQTGQGMLSTLNIASELGGYVIADMGTYMKYLDSYRGSSPLEIIIKGGNKLVNQYSILLVSHDRCPGCNFEAANIFLEWITGDFAQELIKKFKINGHQLFIPNARANFGVLEGS